MCVDSAIIYFYSYLYYSVGSDVLDFIAVIIQVRDDEYHKQWWLWMVMFTTIRISNTAHMDAYGK